MTCFCEAAIIFISLFLNFDSDSRKSQVSALVEDPNHDDRFVQAQSHHSQGLSDTI